MRVNYISLYGYVCLCGYVCVCVCGCYVHIHTLINRIAHGDLAKEVKEGAEGEEGAYIAWSDAGG
jgi:hypothetical protein